MGRPSKEIEWYEWYVNTPVVQNRTDRWFITIMSLTQPISRGELENRTAISRDKIGPFKSNYRLRTWTTGCYYYNEDERAWIAVGMSVIKSLMR